MCKEDKYELERIQMTPKVIKSLECQTYEEHLDEMRLFSLKMSELKNSLVTVYSYVRHCSGKDAKIQLSYLSPLGRAS